jgi:quercetin dioxygenase-like cupin family protein
MTEYLPKNPTQKGPAGMFTGNVYFTAYYTGEGPSRMRLNLVRFAPGAHTAWHRHAVGQTLHVTEGLGYVQSRGGEPLVLRPGDTVHTPRGEWHWHGAAADQFMSHLAAWERSDVDGEPESEWGEHLTDEEYPS